MITLFKMRLMQINHMRNQIGFKGVLRELFYFGRHAVVVSKDLSQFQYGPNAFRTEIQIAELSERNIGSFDGKFSVKNREIKANKYITDGYNAFAALKNGLIVGDIWYDDDRNGTGHQNRDMNWLGIERKNDCAYMFDMFVDPAERGSDIAAHLQSKAMHILKNKGISAVYGYYWKDNLPAKWVHRVLRWKEFKVARCNRILIWKWTTTGGSGDGNR